MVQRLRSKGPLNSQLEYPHHYQEAPGVQDHGVGAAAAAGGGGAQQQVPVVIVLDESQ